MYIVNNILINLRGISSVGATLSGYHGFKSCKRVKINKLQNNINMKLKHLK